MQSEISKWLPEEKVFQLDTSTDAFNILRRIGNQKQRNVSYKNKRAHLLAEEVKFKCNEVSISTIIIYVYFYINKSIYLCSFSFFRTLQSLELL